MGLKAADELEYGWHSGPLLDAELHENLVDGCALHATVLQQAPRPYGVPVDDASGLDVDLDPILMRHLYVPVKRCRLRKRLTDFDSNLVSASFHAQLNEKNTVQKL